MHPRTPIMVSAWLLAPLMMLGSSTLSAAPQRTDKAVELQMNMRKLWEDHITWTRLYIVSAAAGLPDADPTAERLLKNQDDIGKALEPYYGDKAAAGLTALLRQHILGAAALVAAAKAKDDAKVESGRTTWFANADSIADFLSAANPKSWPNAEMKTMMHEHLELTFKQAQDRLKGDYAADIADYDAVHEQILRMADMLSAGIAKQFSKKFE